MAGMGPGGGWSALGAAILGAQNGFYTAKDYQLKKKESDSRLKTASLEQQLAQDKVNELPKVHAAADAKVLGDQLGDDKFDVQGWLDKMKEAGTPIPSRPDLLQAGVNTRVKSIEANPTGLQAPLPLAPDNDTVAANNGISPITGAKVPLAVATNRKDLARKGRLDDLQIDAFQKFLNPEGAQAPPLATEPVQPGVASMPGAVPGMGISAPPVKPTAPPGVDDPALPRGVQQYLEHLQGKFGNDSAGLENELTKAWPQLKAAHPNLDPQRVMGALPGLATPATQPTASNPGNEVPFEDPAAKHQRILGALTGLDKNNSAHESLAHVAAREKAEAEAKAAFRPNPAMVQREIDAYRKIRVLEPQVRQALMAEVHDPNDPHGQKQNPMVAMGRLGLQKTKKAGYGVGYPLSDTDSKVQQLAGLYKVIGASPYMAGSRSMQMFNQAATHLLDGGFLPEANLQRLDELSSIYPDFEKELGLHGQPTTAMPGGQPLKVDASQLPAQTPPASGGGVRVAPGKTVSYADVAARAARLNMDPKVLASRLMAEGVSVTK